MLAASSFAAMQRDSVDSVDLTLGPMTLGFLGSLARQSHTDDPARAGANNLLRGLHEVRIRSFRFAADHAYRRADLEELRSQFTAAGWQRVAHVRDRGTADDLDIYCLLNSHTITQVAIVDAQPREFTWVNIVGTIEPHKIGMLRQSLIPHDDGRSNGAPSR